MTSQPPDQIPPGLGAGDYVTIDEYRNGYNTFSIGLEGRLPPDPEFPAAYLDGKTGLACP